MNVLVLITGCVLIMLLIYYIYILMKGNTEA